MNAHERRAQAGPPHLGGIRLRGVEQVDAGAPGRAVLLWGVFGKSRIKAAGRTRTGARARGSDPRFEWLSGGVLLSHPVPGAVPSALRGLASGFGMDPGVSLSPWPP